MWNLLGGIKMDNKNIEEEKENILKEIDKKSIESLSEMVALNLAYSKSIMEKLENNTKLLERLIESGVKVDSSFSKELNNEIESKIDSNEENENENNGGFNMDFLNQIANK